MTPTPIRRLGARLLPISLSLLIAATAAAAPIQLEGQTLVDRVTLAGSTLQLNGAGVRGVAWLKGYVAGLYLTRKCRTAAEVIAAPGPKRLQLRMLQNVAAPEFAKAFERGVKRHSSDAELAGLLPRMQGFEQLMLAAGKVRKGDVIDVDFVPTSGTTMAVNGRVLGEPITGADFNAALMKVFVGDKVSDPEMKTGLLGGPAT